MSDHPALSQVGAVVVNLDAGEALIGCVESLRRAGIDEIVVVDNASSDGSLVRLAAADGRVRLLPTGANLGYGSAANRGAELIEADYLLVCNPDLVVAPDAIEQLVEALAARPETAVVGPAISGSDGLSYPSARAFPSLIDAAGHALLGLFVPSNPFSRRYRQDEIDPTTERDVDWLSGACLLFRRAAYQSVGGFDEGYFMYVEDLDVCWRLRRAGWKARFVPGAQVVHAQGMSARRHPYKMLVAHHRSTMRFAWRSQGGSRRALVPAAGVLLSVRLVAAVAREFSRTLRAERDRSERRYG